MNFNLKSLEIILIAIFFTSSSCSQKSSEINPIDLNCEYLENPINIDQESPRLSWKLLPVDSIENPVHQTAYEILVATEMEDLINGKADLWKSGKIKSSESVNIHYEGDKLNSRQKVYWKVRIWDQNNNVSEWSEIASWKMALLEEKDWEGASWIGLGEDPRNSDLRFRVKKETRQRESHEVEAYPAPLLRKKFNVETEIKEAFIYISGLGYNEVFINGEKVGDRKLEPGQTTYDDHILYTTYDITKFLEVSKNAIGVYLGNGFYGQNLAFSPNLVYGEPRMIAKIFINYTNGNTQVISSDKTWQATTGPILFDNVYAGETYDARKEIPGWSTASFNATGWQNAVILESPGGYMKSQLMPPIQKIMELKAVDIVQNDEDTWTIDFGQNMSGWAKIKINEKKGTKIHLSYAEALYRNSQKINKYSLGGFATGWDQDDIYICEGEGTETWEPRFTYHGFQYIEISGLTKPPNAETVTGVLAHTDVQPAGNFSCSNELINKIYDAGKWTVVSNLHSIPEDCPHREKCGWLGDAHAFAEFAIFNYNMVRFYTKYMNDIHSVLGRSKIDSEGNPAGVMVPTMVAPGKRLPGEAKLDWGVAIIYLPWYLYLYYDDIQVFDTYYEDMKVFIEHMYTFTNDKGIIENGLGDWCPPRWDRQTNPDVMQCHPYISANAFFYKALKIMSFMADKLDDPEYGVWAGDKAKELKRSFNNEYLVPINNTDKWYGSQTATVMALDFSMVPEEEKENVINGLLYDIKTVNNSHHTVGIHGHRPYYSILTDLGKDELAFKVLTNPTFPSQAYIINAGLTTFPERIWEWEKVEWDRSLNHPMQAGFAAFFHENVLGIKPDKNEPGFKHIIMKPHFINQLKWAKGNYQSVYGNIKSHWQKERNAFSWSIEIPPTSHATVYVPKIGDNIISVKDISLESNKEVKIIEEVENYNVIILYGGEYVIRVE